VNEKDNEVKMITIYILGSLMFIVFLGLEARFGYLFYLLLIPSGMHLLYASKVKFLKPIIIILFLVISLNGMYQINNNVTGDNYNNYLMDKKYSKQLVSLLKEQKDKGKIYLINDVTAICSSMESLAAFSKIQSKIIIINSISKNFKLLSQYSKNELKINFNCEPNGQCIVKMELPPQINFVFDGIAENKIKRETGKLFKRNDELNYQFPNEKIVRYKTSSGTPVYNYGQLLYLEINKVKMNDVIIYFNNGYKTIGLGELI
jgi:hypothetical protein